VFFDGNCTQTRLCNAGFHRQRYGESQERKQSAQLVRIGQVRGLQREALCFEIAEHGLYRPALAISRERMTRPNPNPTRVAIDMELVGPRRHSY
jgi:hypothetical protein